MNSTKHKPILVTQSSMPPIEEYINEIRSLWDSHWLTNMGEKHQLLEAELKTYLDTPQIALFTNGHSALECAFEALNLKGSVITTPFTFASTTHAIVRKGLEPIFADINPVDFTIDPASIEQAIQEDTTAIVPVHVYGNICNVKAIDDIARKYNLKVIYDAAHAFGIKVNNQSVANYGDISMFSFHATKVFNTIEGGALCCYDRDLYLKLNHWKNFGISGPEDVDYIGGNAKMNEFCAAMGICNLRHVDEEIRKRKLVAERYWDRLSGKKGLQLCIPPSNVSYNYAYLPVVFNEEFGLTRDEVFRKLESANVHSRKYFYPLTNDYACYSDRFDSNKTPTAKRISERVLTLPLYANLPINEVDRICKLILEGEM